MSWEPGTVIVLHEVWRGRVWSARPVTVARDCDQLVALWCPRGTRWKAPTTPPDRERAPSRAERFVALLSQCNWVFRDATWQVSNLILVRPGDWHEVRVSWDEGGRPWGWYINFQRPFVRRERSLETMDLMLDIVAHSSRQWQWKDEDEFDTLIGTGLITGAEAAAVRREAEDVVCRLDANGPPFCEPWHDWRADAAWPAARLDDGWDCLEARP